jgi:hypothetical protein
MLMQDAVCEVPIPPETEGKDWREEMREYIKMCTDVFCDHPWFGDLSITSVPLGPNNLQVIDWVLRPMRDFPLNHYEKMSMVLLLSSFARSSGIIRRDMVRAVQAGRSPESFSGLDYTAALKQLVQPERFPNLHPIVMSGAYTGENESENTVGDDFDFGLERILDGIQNYLDLKKAERPDTIEE